MTQAVALAEAKTLPTFETLAKLKPIPHFGRPIRDVLVELNVAIEAAGIEFGESAFSLLPYVDYLPEKFDDFRWIDCCAVRGGNEGYYAHITGIPRRHDKEPSLLIATAKTWCWPSALAMAAAATKLLSD
ncbi:MAG: hypothetical protein DI537_32875 [Stutzerimonas stutzeri]|nr:MAG: hypothetical protein DI537_32875 [Stutzerimonas stutzeri]